MSVKFFKLCDSIRMIHSILRIANFLRGKSHGQRSLVGYSPWGRKDLKKLDKIEQLSTHIHNP